MKKLLLLLALPLVFAACSKEKENYDAYPSLILGTWEITNVSMDLSIPGLPAAALKEIQDEFYVMVQEDFPYKGSTFVFKDGNTVTDPDGEDVAYSISGNRLTFKYDGGSETFTITTLNNTALTLSINALPYVSEFDDTGMLAGLVKKFDIIITTVKR